MTDLKRVSKFDSDDCGFLFEFDGDPHFLSEDDMEMHLVKYFKIRERLRLEKKLRKQYPSLDEAYKEYLVILEMVR